MIAVALKLILEFRKEGSAAKADAAATQAAKEAATGVKTREELTTTAESKSTEEAVESNGAAISSARNEAELITSQEVYDLWRLVNVYSMAAIWLGFTMNVACAEGCDDRYKQTWYWPLVVVSNATIYACALMASSRYDAREHGLQPSPHDNVELSPSSVEDCELVEMNPIRSGSSSNDLEHPAGRPSDGYISYDLS